MYKDTPVPAYGSPDRMASGVTMAAEPILAGTVKGISNTREALAAGLNAIDEYLAQLGFAVFASPKPVNGCERPHALLHVLEEEACELVMLTERVHRVAKILAQQLAH